MKNQTDGAQSIERPKEMSNVESEIRDQIKMIQGLSADQSVELFSTHIKRGWTKETQIVMACFVLKHFWAIAIDLKMNNVLDADNRNTYNRILAAVSALGKFLSRRFPMECDNDGTAMVTMTKHMKQLTYFLHGVDMVVPCKHANFINRICCTMFVPFSGYTGGTIQWKKQVVSCRKESEHFIEAYDQKVWYCAYFFLALNCSIPVVHALVTNNNADPFGSKKLCSAD